MNLGRSDTYINVYLPREDGDDPRRYAEPSSPVFCSDEVYKFSDEIVKDRKLFLGKKQMSLYEIYYKDNKGSGNNLTENGETSDSDEHDYRTGLSLNRRNKRSDQFELPHVPKLSISLDNRLRRPQKTNMTRFNEPTYSYSKHKGYGYTNYDPNQSLERQVTSYDYMRLASRRQVTSESIKAKQRAQTISRLSKKALSAPSEVRQIRSLGLPPISRSSTTLTALLPVLTSSQSRARTTTSKTRQVRPSSKPHRIWQQTNDMMNGYESSKTMEPGVTPLKLASSRSRHNVSGANDIFV